MSHARSDNNFFTRHLFRSGCICPRKLFYKSRDSVYPERGDDLPFFVHARFNKHQLKSLIEATHPEGIRLTWNGPLQTSEETTGYLDREDAVLFDAAFTYENYFARIPCLLKSGDRVKIYQVETRAFKPGRHSLTGKDGMIHSKWKDYIIDFSYRLFIIRQLYPDWSLEPYLVLPDKTGATQTDRLDQKILVGREIDENEITNLLAFIPVMEYVERLWDGRESLFADEVSHPLKGKPYKKVLETMAGWYFNEVRVPVDIGKKCSSCEFRVQKRALYAGQKSGFRECWEGHLNGDVDEPHIFDLIGPGNRELLDSGIYLQMKAPFDRKLLEEQVLESEQRLTDYHRRLLQLGKQQMEDLPQELVKPQLFRELKRWEYPLHFLDFEAGSYAVPLKINRKPYHLVAFQYSCHTLHDDGSLVHHQWIDTDDMYPNYQLIKKLMKVPDIVKGTIVQYSGFERRALKKILKELKAEPDAVENLSELVSWIRNIVRREDSSGTQPPFMADLSRLVRRYYYNIEMEDSLSIKDVLRSVMEISPVLRERFTSPYESENFDGIVWWQQENGRVRNPYEILQERKDGSVGRGSEAMVAYSRLRSGSCSKEEFDQIRDALLSYCELDTLAMVMIHLHWKVLLEQSQS